MGSRLRLLLLEDRPDDARLVVRQLTRSGLDFDWRRVTNQRDLEAALEDAPDAVLADFHMPRMEVHRALRTVKERTPDVPFIVVSGTMNEGNGIELLKQGADDYLLKDRLERLVTAIDQARQRIQERRDKRAIEERFQRLVQELPGYVYTCELGAGGRTTYISPQVESMLGVKPEDYVADPASWRNSIHPDDREWVEARFYTCTRAGRPFDYEYRVVSRHGDVRWVRDQAVVLRHEAGTGAYAQGVVLDVTERRKAQQAVMENEAKNRFLANMSHELRNPLNSVLGFAELLQTRDFEGLTARQRRYLGNIQMSGQQLLALVNDLLDLSKVVAGMMPVNSEAVDLDRVVSECLEQMQPQALERGVTLRKADTEGRSVVGDRQRVLQVLINLVSNGIKFTPPGGVITIRAEAAGRVVRIKVIDTGPGIPEDKLEYIFDEFAQLEPIDQEVPRGTGLGLPLSRRLAELMGGDLEVRSRPGAGSTFIVTLPAGSEAA